MRQNAAFALKLPDVDGSPLPHAKELKVQIGGLLGLQGLLFSEKRNDEKVKDIAHIISQAVQQFGSLTEIPFNEIVKSITSFEGRPRRTNKR